MKGWRFVPDDLLIDVPFELTPPIRMRGGIVVRYGYTIQPKDGRFLAWRETRRPSKRRAGFVEFSRDMWSASRLLRVVRVRAEGRDKSHRARLDLSKPDPIIPSVPARKAKP